MAIAMWLENKILHGAISYWWLLLVAAYLITALDVSLRNLQHRDRLLLAGAGVCIVAFVVLFGQLLTVYLSATLLIAISLSAWHRESGQGRKFTRVILLALVCLAVALLVLPTTVNRVEIRLPNLSAGTTFTLLNPSDQRDFLDAQFVNRKDDHSELKVYLGTEIVPGSGGAAPRLRIAIERARIVVRILSVRYQSHIAFFDVTTGEWSGRDLTRLIELNPDSPASLEMEGERLLISNLTVDTPLTLVFPGTDRYRFPGKVWFLSMLIRLLLLGLIGYAAVVWAPRAGRHRGGNCV